MNPQISVIIPVYNTGRYLERCIESVLAQTFSETQIILIDDGSMDNSAQLCDAYANKDARIQVQHKKHEGVGAARNDGIDASLGKYIMFVDSDDWVESQFCEIPFRIAESKQADLVMFANCIQKNRDRQKRVADLKEGFISHSTAMFLVNQRGVNVGAWNKLYRKELFDTIRYPEGYVYEDIGTTYKLVHAAKKIYYSNTKLYNYTAQREGSITSRKDISSLSDFYEMVFRRAQDLIDWGYDYSEWLSLQQLSYMVHMGWNQAKSEECDRAVRNISGYPGAFTLKQKGMLFLYRHSTFLFDAVCRITGKRDVK